MPTIETKVESAACIRWRKALGACDLVDEMRKKTDTRFIAITHNPITMARMDRLYGVTMAERGVSQFVSVALAEAEELLEAV